MADTERRTLRVFISSPADVRPERLIAERVVQRLDQEFALHLDLRAVMWEREPLLASHHFQDLITPPHETEIVVVILWSRLGTTLPGDRFTGPLSGCEVSGTEWEFEDALKSYREHNSPAILMYRKTAVSTVGLDDTNAASERLEQKKRLDAFVKKWFAAHDGGNPSRASWEFAGAAQFEEMLEDCARWPRDGSTVGRAETGSGRAATPIAASGRSSSRMPTSSLAAAAPATNCARSWRAVWNRGKPLCWYSARAARASRRWSRPASLPTSLCPA